MPYDYSSHEDENRSNMHSYMRHLSEASWPVIAALFDSTEY